MPLKMMTFAYLSYSIYYLSIYEIKRHLGYASVYAVLKGTIFPWN